MSLTTTDREKIFVENFCTTLYAMKMAEYSASMCADFCHPSRGVIRRTLNLTQAAMRSKIADLTLKLRSDKYQEISADIRSEEVQALSLIMQEIIEYGEVLEIETELLSFIKELKNRKNDRG